jgi:hypothetical protein
MIHGYVYYRTEAAKFRSMARDCDAETARSLLLLANDYEAEARRLEQAPEATMKVPCE